MAQVQSALSLKDVLGLDDVILDFMELVGLGNAVSAVHAAGLRAVIATPRVQKPGEEGYDRRFEQLRPDGILARHWGAVRHFIDHPSPLAVHGDFSLNATNALTARTLLGFGLTTLTPGYDLDRAQLVDLCRASDPSRLEVTLHQHLPLYHTEHCVYAHTLSEGRDYKTCGRPCEAHAVSLRDQQGLEHPVLVDIGCRNTVFNAQAQSAASCFQELVAVGVRRFRVELVRESSEETRSVLLAYHDLLAGGAAAREVVRRVGALERYGVTVGTLAIVEA
jgi:putative protease